MAVDVSSRGSFLLADARPWLCCATVSDVAPTVDHAEARKFASRLRREQESGLVLSRQLKRLRQRTADSTASFLLQRRAADATAAWQQERQTMLAKLDKVATKLEEVNKGGHLPGPGVDVRAACVAPSLARVSVAAADSFASCPCNAWSGGGYGASDRGRGAESAEA